MAKIKTHEFDMAQGLKMKNLTLPKMLVEVFLEADKTLEKKIKEEPLLYAKLCEAGSEALKEHRKKFQKAIQAFDEEVAAAADVAALEKHQRTINAICKQLVEVAGDMAVSSMQACWKGIIAKDKELKSYRLGIFKQVTLGLIAIAAGVMSIVTSVGVLAVSIISAYRGFCDFVTALMKVAQFIDETSKDLSDLMRDLKKRFDGELSRAQKAGEIGRDLLHLASSHPLVRLVAKSTKEAEDLAKTYSAKITEMDKLSSDLAKDIVRKLDGLDDLIKTVQNKEQKKIIKSLQGNVDKLLKDNDKLRDQIKAHSTCLEEHRANIQKYSAMRGNAVNKISSGVKSTALVGGLLATAKTGYEIAKKLA